MNANTPASATCMPTASSQADGVWAQIVSVLLCGGRRVLRLTVDAVPAKPHWAGATYETHCFGPDPSGSTAPDSMTCPIESRTSTVKVVSDERTHADTTRPRAIEVTARTATPSISSTSAIDRKAPRAQGFANQADEDQQRGLKGGDKPEHHDLGEQVGAG